MVHNFWICPSDIKCCESDNKEKYVVDWPIVSNTWSIKIGATLSKNKVLVLEEIDFQLQQKDALSSCKDCNTTNISMWRQIWMPTQLLDCWRQCVASNNNPNESQKQIGVGHLDGYYVVGVIAIPYPGLGMIINIIYKEDNSYRVTIGDIPHWTCPEFTKCHLRLWERERNGWTTNIYIMCLDLCARWSTIVACSFTLPHSPITRSCDYLNLLVL